MTEQIDNGQLFENDEAALDNDFEPADMKRFLTFHSDKLLFGVLADNVVEIINNHYIRKVPMVPDYIQGIINLRGQIIPIVDMRLLMNKPFKEYNSKTCIIVLNIDSNIIGIVVDAVSQVIDIDLLKASSIPGENKQKFTKQMVSLEDNSVVLLLECQEILEQSC